MVQSGIAYAAGQLLAVVAPRTVLVVDAPTDWSLAGPLWELALDDAPVDEILDVLIRRGIRTAPSFAIVRVENDAVRALVRGSVPVCFERVGEPVRLDATGATTWLEGLISSARRVLVGAVETNTSLPYLVSTGVVLVSGLALPCGPSEQSRGGASAGSSQPAVESDAGPTSSGSEGSSYFSRPPAPVASGAFNSAAGREPRVVDLTRSGGRSPAKAYAAAPESRESWSLASSRNGSDAAAPERGEMNGHTPPVLTPSPVLSASPVFAPSEPLDAKPALDRPDPLDLNTPFEKSPFDAPVFDEPVADSSTDLDSGPALESALDSVPAVESSTAAESRPALASSPSIESTPASDSVPADEPSPSIEPAASFGSASAFEPGSRFEPSSPFEPSSSFGRSSRFEPSAEPEPLPERFALRSVPAADDPGELQDLDRSAESDPADQPELLAALDPFDDLLIQPAGDEAPRGPSPVDLPNFDPPSLSLPKLNGAAALGVPAQPRSFGGVPAAWPPAPESPGEDAQHPYRDGPSDAESQARTSIEPTEVIHESGQAQVNAESSTPEASNPDSAQPPLGDLPLRVRGRSLRPEQRSPLNGSRLAGPPSPAIDPSQDGDSAASGSLLLPAFFRGARAARQPDSPEAPEAPLDDPAALQSVDDDAASPWAPPKPKSNPAPSAWVPPVRRGFGDRSGFNGGPPAMPGVLRPSGNNDSDSANAGPGSSDNAQEPTEVTPGPGSSGANGSGPDTPREPPRLLGVWCDAGHVTSPDHEECRVCGLAVPAQAPILVARPPLGVLIFDDGDRVVVDRPVVLGRDPKPVSSPDPETPVLHAVPSATGQVSRTHAEIRAAGWDVVLTDLDAMNGTALTLPGASPVAIEPGVPTVITPGARVDLGGESGFVFEVEA